MRVRRYLLAMLMLTTGAVIARPDDVRPLASKIAAALRTADAGTVSSTTSVEATGSTSSTDATAPSDTSGAAHGTDTAGHALPSFVTTNHSLAMPGDGANDGGAGGAPASSPSVRGDVQQIKPVDTTESDGASAADRSAALNLPDPVDTSLDASGKAQKQPDSPEVPAESVKGTPLVPAKKLFGAVKGPSLLQARSIGTYSRGCLAGAKALPVDGPAWQAMRLSRNRNWGHPQLIDLVEKLAVTAQKQDGWNGLLVGDISQPRGGPMLTGHASHQLGLDADIWFTPMPDRTLTRQERENIAATSMLDGTDLAVDPKVFGEKQVALIKRAASFPEVERVLVHPAIKKALCQAAGTDRGWLGKVRPIQGHYYHFHVRIGCPAGSVGCVSQKAVTGDDGCAKEVDEWLQRMARAKLPAPPKPPGWKPSPPPPPVTMSQLPADCRMVLESGADGVQVPDSAMLPPKPAKAEKAAKKHEPLIKATITLRPAKDRRAAGTVASETGSAPQTSTSNASAATATAAQTPVKAGPSPSKN